MFEEKLNKRTNERICNHRLGIGEFLETTLVSVVLTHKLVRRFSQTRY